MTPEATRTPKSIIALGTNGTGKTTFLKKLVIAELKKKDSHVLIVVLDDMEWDSVDWVHPKFPQRIERYVGVRKIAYFDGLIGIIRERFYNGLLIFDDCRSYWNRPNAVEGELHTLLQKRRQHMIDIVVAAHGFTEVPPKMFTFATHYVLFRTKDNMDRRKNVMAEDDYVILKEAQMRINEKAVNQPHYFEIIKTV